MQRMIKEKIVATVAWQSRRKEGDLGTVGAEATNELVSKLRIGENIPGKIEYIGCTQLLYVFWLKFFSENPYSHERPRVSELKLYEWKPSDREGKQKKKQIHNLFDQSQGHRKITNKLEQVET